MPADFVITRVKVHEARTRIDAARIGYNKMRRITRFVHERARAGAAAGTYSHGVLAASITAVGPIIAGEVVTSFIGSVLPYAASVERGARIHNIFPKGASEVFRFGDRERPQLRFIWRGRLVFTPHVPMAITTIGRSHPGQRGKRFLRKSLREAARVFNMRFVPGIGSF